MSADGKVLMVREHRVRPRRAIDRALVAVVALAGAVLLGVAVAEGIIADAVMSIFAGMAAGALAWRARHKHAEHHLAAVVALRVRDRR